MQYTRHLNDSHDLQVVDRASKHSVPNPFAIFQALVYLTIVLIMFESNYAVLS
jgi:hypothetical protein